MKKGKVIVPLALCVCAILIVIGIALGNNPMRSSIGQGQSAEVIFSEESKASESSDAAESTESAASSSEDSNAGLTSEQIAMGDNDDSSTYNGPSEEMLALAKSMTPKELYENTYDRKPEWMKSRQTYHILREDDGTLTTESGEAPVYHADNGLNIEVTDVHASNTLEYGLTEEDGWFGEECGLDESGTITNPDYVFVCEMTLRLLLQITRLQSVTEYKILLMKKSIMHLQHMKKTHLNMLLQSMITVLPQLSLMLRRS